MDRSLLVSRAGARAWMPQQGACHSRRGALSTDRARCGALSRTVAVRPAALLARRLEPARLREDLVVELATSTAFGRATSSRARSRAWWSACRPPSRALRPRPPAPSRPVEARANRSPRSRHDLVHARRSEPSVTTIPTNTLMPRNASAWEPPLEGLDRPQPVGALTERLRHQTCRKHCSSFLCATEPGGTHLRRSRRLRRCAQTPTSYAAYALKDEICEFAGDGARVFRLGSAAQ